MWTLASIENPPFSQASMSAAAIKTEQILDLIQQNPRHRRDGFRPVSENSP
jgi:hypothetical protein